MRATDAAYDMTRKRAIIVVARFSDGSRRVRACETAEDARAFVAGEDLWRGRHPHREPLGGGTVERRTEVFYDTSDELVAALKDAIR